MKWFKYVLSVIAVLFALLLFLMSGWGVSIISSQLNSMVDGLHLEHRSGGVFGRLEFNTITFKNDSSQIQANNVVLDINWICSIPVQLCVDELAIGKLDVNQSQAAASPADESEQQKITLPWPVSLPNIIVDEVSIAIENTAQLQWSSLRANIDMFKTLTIKKLHLAAPQVNLPASNEQPKPIDIEAIANFDYQPIQLDQLVIPIDVVATEVLITKGLLQQDKQDIAEFDRLKTQFTIKNSHVELRQLVVEHSLANLQAIGSLSPEYQVDLQAKLDTQQDAKQTYQATLKLTGDLDKLEINANLRGIYQAQLDASVDLQSSELPIDASLTWDALTLALEQPIDVERGQLTLVGNMTQYKLSAQTGLSSAAIPSMQLNIDAQGNPKRISVNQIESQTLDGKSLVDGELWLTDKINWQGHLALSNIQPQAHWPELSATINAQTTVAGSWAGPDDLMVEMEQLAANGQWLGYPLSASGSAAYSSKDGLQIPELLVSNGDNQLTLSGNMDTEQNVSADFQLDAQALSQVYPGLTGQLTMTSSLAGTLQQPSVEYQLNAQNLVYDWIELNAGQSQGSLTWNDTKPVDLSLKLSNLVINREPIDTITFTLTGDAQSHSLTTLVAAQVLSFDSTISGSLSESKWQGTWDRGEFGSQYGDYLLTGDAPQILLDWGAQKYRISPHCWQDKDAQLCINQGSFEQQVARFNMQGKKLELLQIASQFVPQLSKMSSDTRLFFDIEGQWQPDSMPIVNANGYMTPSEIKIVGLTKPLDMQTLAFDIDANDEDVKVKLDMATQQSGSIDVDVNIQRVRTDQVLAGQIKISKLLLAPYQELVPQLSELTGYIDGNLQLSGDLETPLLGGKLTLEKLTLAGDALPGRVEGWTQHVEFDGQKAKIQGEFTFGNGKGTSSGSLDWSGELLGQLSLQGEQFELEYRDTVRARFSPDIKINMTEKAFNVDGKIDVFYARIKVKELPPDAKSPSEDTVIVNQPDIAATSQRPIKMELRVNVDPQKTDNVKLEAFGLKTDLRGSLELKQNGRKLTGFGDLQLINGTYKAYGQDLVIRQGDIRFAGPLDNPSLNIEAIRARDRTQDDVIAGIRVTGAAEQPSVEIFSQPTMVQIQALSYLVTGKDINKKDGAQTPENQMLMNVLLNAGLKGSENKVDQLGRSFGIEDLALGTTSGDDGGTQVSLSGYIAPGVQLSYGVNVFDSTSEVSLRYQILSNLFIEATSGAQNALDLLYQFSVGGTKPVDTTEGED